MSGAAQAGAARSDGAPLDMKLSQKPKAQCIQRLLASRESQPD